jgi:hypothetical protein
VTLTGTNGGTGKGAGVGRKPRAANERLRALIEEAGVSHKGLARRVVDLAEAQGVSGLSYDHSSVIRWLAGEQPRQPAPELIAQVLTGLLQRQVGAADLGMAPSAVTADLGLTLVADWGKCVATAATLWRVDLERRRFLHQSALALSAPSTAALQWLVSPPADPPVRCGRRQIGAADVDTVQSIVQSYRELDNRLGGGRTRSAVVQYLDTEITPLLADGRYSAAVGRGLAEAGAELAQLAGWMAYDCGLHGHAQRYLTLALSFAYHAGSAGLGAEILAAQAHQAVYLGRPAEAVDLARAAQATAKRAGLPTLRAECYVMEAHGHAASNDARACAQALTEAETAFGQAVREDDPVWLRYFDEAYLAARMSHCFRALGEPGHAERYARRSLHMDGRFVRGKTFNLALLATALAEQDHVEESCAVGIQAVHLAAGLRSARSVRYIKDLQRALRRRADTPAVRDLNAQAAERLPAASARAEGR